MTLKHGLAWAGGVVGVLIVLLVAGGAALWLYYAPRVDQYRLRIERIASARLGTPVEISGLSVVWHGFGPELRLRDIKVLSADRRQQAASVAAVRVDLTPLSFLSWPAVHPSAVAIEKPRVEVERTPDGGLRLRGLPASGSGMQLAPRQIFGGLSRIGTLRISGGEIDFSAPAEKISGWRFRDVSVRMEEHGGAHCMQLSVKLPAPMGRGAGVTLTFDYRHGEGWHWQGRLRVADFKLASLKALAPRLPAEFRGGAANATLSASGLNGRPLRADGTVRPVARTAATAGALSADLGWRRGAGGKLHLAARNFALDFPGLFRGPLKVGRADVPLTFSHNTGGWRFGSRKFELANGDLTTGGRFSVLLPADGAAPRIDVNASAAGIDLAVKSRYLPVGIMPKEVTEWVDRSVKSGKVPHVEVIFRGPADAFPFRHGGGLFKVAFSLRDARIKFDPHWPAVSGLNAEVEFKGAGLSARVGTGRISGLAIAGTTATIADLARADLVIDGTTRGDAANAMAFLRDSPLAQRFGSYIDKIHARGKLAVDVALDLPLTDIDRFKVHGQAHLSGVDVTLGGFRSGFEALAGELDFSNTGLDSPGGLKAQFLGAPVAIGVHPGRRGSNTTSIRVSGKTGAASLAKAMGHSAAGLASGAFEWRARVTLPNEIAAAGTPPLTVSVHSDLQGLALSLPAPFAKQAKQNVATSALLVAADGGFELSGRYGDTIRTKLKFGDSGLTAGAIHFGADRARLPDSGLIIDGHLDSVALAGWQKLAGLMPGADHAAALPPVRVALQVGSVNAFGQHFRNVVAHARSAGGGYRLTLAGPDIAGRIALPRHADNDHPYRMNLDHLHLGTGFAKSRDSRNLSPTVLPPLRFTGSDIAIGKANLGRVAFELRRVPGGVALAQFSATGKGLKLTLNGRWVEDDGGRQQTQLKATATSDNVSAAFAALNLPAALTADKARINADLNWPGPPGSGLPGRLNGTMTVHLEDGQLTEISPGAARLLGLLSLNALPRRLLFNFRDVFSEGFSYDTIGGDFLLKGGNAYTHNFRLESPAADVRVVGRVGLGKEDYDEVVTVNTSIPSTLPVAGAIAGGPITGAAVFLLTEIFKLPLKKATQIEYHVTGTWDNPVMKPISGKLPAPKRPPESTHDQPDAAVEHSR